MESLVENLEREVAVALLLREQPLQELACENILIAIQAGIVQLNCAETERLVLEQSIKAGRGALEVALMGSFAVTQEYTHAA